VFNEKNEANQAPSSSRAARKQATARAVLDAARAEFERVGYEAASLRAIAARAGVSAGTVIHHHGDKRDLLHAALFDDLEATLTRVLARLGDGPLEAQLARLTRGVFAYYLERPGLSRTLLAHSLFADPPWAERFSAQVAGVHARIAGLAGAARARGELAGDADAALLGAAYFAFFYFALIAWAQGRNPHPARLVEALVAQHLAGLRPRVRSKRKKPSPT